MKRLNLAFIGGAIDSAIGTTHKIASQMDSRFELVSGCFSIDKKVNDKTGELWYVERLYSDWRSLLANEGESVDAVVVLTPTSLHTKIVIAAIKAGYPVICEKALTNSLQDGKKISQALRKHKGYLAVTYNYTGYPIVREIRSIIQHNKLGLIQQIHIEMPQEGYARLNSEGKTIIPQDWRLRDGMIPTISLDLGVHLHSIINYLTGEKPLEVMALQNSFGHFKQVVDNVICVANYTNGLVCNLWYGKAALGYRNGLKIRVFGEKGSAEWFQMDPEKLHLSDNKGHTCIIDRGSVDVSTCSQERYVRFKAGHPAGFIEAFANLYNDIADEIISYKNKAKHKSAHVFDVQKTLEGLSMLEAIDRSHKLRSWQKVRKID